MKFINVFGLLLKALSEFMHLVFNTFLWAEVIKDFFARKKDFCSFKSTEYVDGLIELSCACHLQFGKRPSCFQILRGISAIAVLQRLLQSH